MIYKPWTSRDVWFDLYPSVTDEEYDRLVDALVDHYWERPAWVRRWVEPGIGAHGKVVHITGLPWWMPKWWALRTVAAIAHRHEVGGIATFRVERVVL